MAGRRQKPSEVPSNSLIAAAVPYQGENIKKIDRVYRPTAPWQKDAWNFYDITPELRFAAGWIGNALSRCYIRAGEVDPTGVVIASEDKSITAALSALFAGSDGQAQLLQTLGIHLTVAGEAFLVGRTRMDPEGKRGIYWEVIGVNEITVAGNQWSITYEGNAPIRLADDDTIIRIWRPHPNKRMEADSPIRALLPILTEIEYLTRHIFAQTISRLAGAGMQVFPDSVEFPGSDKVANKAEGLMKALGGVMSKSLADPGDPSALIPVFVTVPESAVDKIKPPIHYWSPLDAAAVDTRRAALARFGTGMDLPPEIIAGMTASGSSSGGTGTGVSHWTSWQIEESAIKLHIEPLLETIGNALVIGYVRPVTGKANAAVVYDTERLKLQPDRSKEALELFDRGQINGKTLRKHNGFGESEVMDEKEFARWLLVSLARASATPDQVAKALDLLGVKGIPDGMGQMPVHPGTNQPQTPSLREHPRGTALPGRMSLLAAISEPLVLRALERAGGRLRNQGIKPPGVPQHEIYLHATTAGTTGLLEGAWSMVPTVCTGIAESDKLTPVLQSYVENLLVEHLPHSREAMERYLELVPE